MNIVERRKKRMKTNTLGIMAIAMIAFMGVNLVSAQSESLTNEEDVLFSQIREAVISQDYETWRELILEANSKMIEELLNEERFNLLVERAELAEDIREAYDAEDFEQVRELKKEYRELVRGNDSDKPRYGESNSEKQEGKFRQGNKHKYGFFRPVLDLVNKPDFSFHFAPKTSSKTLEA